MKRSPLRRTSALKRGNKPMRKTGRRGKRNLKAFYINRKFFENESIDYCERCGSHWNLQMAHRFKRFDIKTFGELCTTVKLCGECHRYCDEVLSHSEMFAELTRIINERETRFQDAP